jgi:hypothetical protein
MANTYQVIDLETGHEIGTYRSADAFWPAREHVTGTGSTVAILDVTDHDRLVAVLRYNYPNFADETFLRDLELPRVVRLLGDRARYYAARDGGWCGPRRLTFDAALRDLDAFQAHRERDPHCSCAACCEQNEW